MLIFNDFSITESFIMQDALTTKMQYSYFNLHVFIRTLGPNEQGQNNLNKIKKSSVLFMHFLYACFFFCKMKQSIFSSGNFCSNRHYPWHPGGIQFADSDCTNYFKDLGDSNCCAAHSSVATVEYCIYKASGNISSVSRSV